MTSSLLGYLELLIYDASIIIIGVFAARHLIYYWHLQRSIGQTFVDTEMMKRQLEFQKELHSLGNPLSETAVQ